MRKLVISLGAAVFLALGAAVFIGQCSVPQPSQKELQVATSNAASAIIAKAAVDTALSQHAIDSIVAGLEATSRRATTKHAVAAAASLKKLVAVIPAATKADTGARVVALAIAVDTANVTVETQLAQIANLEADTTRLGNDNRRLAAAAKMASKRLTQDTTVVLPGVKRPKFLGITLPSLRTLLPAITVQKDIVRFDPATGKTELALTSFSAGLGWTIHF